MYRSIAPLLLILAATPAAAQSCNEGDAVAFQCDFKSGKRVTICSNATMAGYLFGKPGATPELSLRTPLRSLDYSTTGGTGMETIAVVFNNGKTAYNVEYTTYFDRLGDEGQITEAGGESGEIRVVSKGRMIAHLECREGTINENFDSIPKKPCRDSCSPSE